MEEGRTDYVVIGTLPLVQVACFPPLTAAFFESIKEICKDKNVGKEEQHIAKRRSVRGEEVSR